MLNCTSYSSGATLSRVLPKNLVFSYVIELCYQHPTGLLIGRKAGAIEAVSLQLSSAHLVLHRVLLPESTSKVTLKFSAACHTETLRRDFFMDGFP